MIYERLSIVSDPQVDRLGSITTRGTDVILTTDPDRRQPGVPFVDHVELIAWSNGLVTWNYKETQ